MLLKMGEGHLSSGGAAPFPLCCEELSCTGACSSEGAGPEGTRAQHLAWFQGPGMGGESYASAFPSL